MFGVVTEYEKKLMRIIEPYMDGTDFRDDAPEKVKKAREELIRINKVDVEDL